MRNCDKKVPIKNSQKYVPSDKETQPLAGSINRCSNAATDSMVWLDQYIKDWDLTKAPEGRSKIRKFKISPLPLSIIEFRKYGKFVIACTYNREVSSYGPAYSVRCLRSFFSLHSSSLLESFRGNT